MAARTLYHVLPHEDGWQVKLNRSSRASSVHTTKAAAVKAASKLAKSKAPSQLVIHHSDRTIAERRNYGDGVRDAGRAAAKRSAAAKKAAQKRKAKARKEAAARSAAAKKAAIKRRKR